MRSFVRLPTLSPIHAQALSLVTSPEFDVERYVAVVSVDPALTIAALHAANSASSSPRAPVTSARDAVVRLGARETRRVLTSVVLASYLSLGLSRSSLDVDAFWRHLVTCALVAEEAAPEEASGTAFVAGLVHDIGRLAMANAEPATYRGVIALARAGDSVLEAEERLFNQSHASLGAKIAEAWNLPESIISAIRDHHDPLAPPGSLAHEVRRARRIAEALGTSDGVRPATRTSSDAPDTTQLIDRAGGHDALEARVETLCSAVLCHGVARATPRP